MDEELKMPLGVEVGLGPGNIVLDGDPAQGDGGGGHWLVQLEWRPAR